MDRVQVAAILEEIILQMQDRESLINDAALVLVNYDETDEQAGEWCDRFMHHGHKRGEFDEIIRKLLTALEQDEE